MPHAYRMSKIMARARTFDLSHHDSVDILTMGDLHITSAHVDIGMIRSAVDWLGAQPNRYAVVPGDVFDTAIKGSVSLDLGEAAMSAKDGRHLLAKILEPVRDRFLAIITGNHDHRLIRDTGECSVDALCCQLGLPFFPEGEAFLRILVGKWNHQDSPVQYRGYVTHGNAGGRLPGAKANGLLAMRNIVHNADFYINGHGHTPLIIPEVAWHFEPKGNVVEQSQWFVSCGASLKRAGYPVHKSYPPLARVFPTLTLHGGERRMAAGAET